MVFHVRVDERGVCVCVCADVVCVRLCRDGEGILGGAGAQGGAEAEFAPAARGRHVCGAGEQQGEPWLSLISLIIVESIEPSLNVKYVFRKPSRCR